MSQVKNIQVPEVQGVRFAITAPGAVSIEGVIAIADPRPSLAGFFRGMHDAVVADGLSEFVVDVRRLTFVNSSAIRLFVDWATWVTQLNGRGYKLRFRTDRRVTWQRTSFAALQSLTGDAIGVDSE